VDGMRLEWVRLVRPDVASIVATVVGNLAHNPGNGPVTVID
jgi:DNA-binding TFAR19-related protein (PDSD5 family)